MGNLTLSFFYLPRSLWNLANVADVFMFTCHNQLRQLMDTIHKSTQPITDSPEHEQLRIGYNVTHDAGLIAMGFEVGTTSDEAWVDPPAHRVGVDVMHLSIPDRFTFQTFVETVGDAVSTLFPGFSVPPLHPTSFRCFSALRDRVPTACPPPPLPLPHVIPKPGGRKTIDF